jgi:hypothetical protein
MQQPGGNGAGNETVEVVLIHFHKTIQSGRTLSGLSRAGWREEKGYEIKEGMGAKIAPYPG